jgi:hypothetical protein
VVSAKIVVDGFAGSEKAADVLVKEGGLFFHSNLG